MTKIFGSLASSSLARRSSQNPPFGRILLLAPRSLVGDFISPSGLMLSPPNSLPSPGRSLVAKSALKGRFCSSLAL